jgi:hypothetical protein
MIIMKQEWKLVGGLLLSSVVMSSQVAVLAQQKPVEEKGVVISQQRIMQDPDNPHGKLPPDTFVFVSSEMNFDGKLVKGAPYSAEAVTETVQTLGDGNRIVNKSSALIYRDSEGRTRREYTFKAIGALPIEDAPQMVSINDPVAGVNYSLDTRSKTAHKMAPMQFKFKISSDGEKPPEGAGVRVGPERTEMRIERSPVPPGGTAERVEVLPEVFVRHAPGPGVSAGVGGGVVMQWKAAGSKKDAKVENLGKQTVEGVEAEGSRTTFTIPAGEVGNERAIEIVSESWYSPELQVIVMSRNSDPRVGETTYRLTNINRAEQPKSLFEVPGDFTVQEPQFGPPGSKMRMKKPGIEE